MCWECILSEVIYFLIIWFTFGMMSVILLGDWKKQVLP